MRAISTAISRVILPAGLILSDVVPVCAWETNDWEFIDRIQQASFRAYRETKVGPWQLPCDSIIYDTPYNFGSITSIAGIGFKLSSMCIGLHRGWLPYAEAYGEVLRLLRVFGNEYSSDPNVFPRANGWTYHFYNNTDGTMNPKDGLSLLDHMLFIGGVIMVAEYFKGTPAGDLALRLYSETQWDNTGSGDANYTAWGYAENLLAIIEAADAPQHNKHASASNMWANVTAGVPYHLPLYYWQYPHCYLDFRARWDPRGRNHENIARDTILHQSQWCNDRFWDWKLAGGWECATYTNYTFGLSACGSSTGYRILDAVDEWSSDSGSISPICIPPCMIYAGTETMATLKYLFEEYYIKGWTPPQLPMWSDVYGWLNCFNSGRAADGRAPFSNGWNADIDYGPNVLLLENYRLGTTWRFFMQNPCIATGMHTVGFGPVQNVTLADFTNALNQFGGGIGHWENDGTPATAAFVLLASNVNPRVAGHIVRFTADNAREGGWVELGGRDQRGQAQISFWARGHTGQERIMVGLKDVFNRERKTPLLAHTGGAMPTDWTEVKIPLETFCITGVVSNDIWPGNLTLISFEFTNAAGGGLDLDYLAFGRDTLPPAAPTGTLRVAHAAGRPRVFWGAMDRARDVIGYRLLRRASTAGVFVAANRWLAPAHLGYADDESLGAAAGTYVEYALQAVDNAQPQNSSPTSAPAGFTYRGGGRGDIDWGNGTNPNVFGGTNDAYSGPGGAHEFGFVFTNLPDGGAGWARRSYVSLAPATHAVDLNGADAGDYTALAFYMRGAAGGEAIRSGLRDSAGRETALDLRASTAWQRVVISFNEFTNLNLTALSRLLFTHQSSGTVFLADLGFVTDTRADCAARHRVEAEHWTAQTGATVRDFKFAASGREVLGESWGAHSNDWAAWDFYLPAARTNYGLSIGYACGSGDGRSLEAAWNATPMGALRFVNTGGWGEQGGHFSTTTVSLAGVLTAGWHRLELRAASNDTPVNLDCLTLAEPGAPYFRECEDYTSQAGSSGPDAKAGASGGAVLGMSWGQAANSTASYSNVGARAVNGAWLYLWYSLNATSGRVVDAWIDGALRARLACPGTAGWGDHACDFNRVTAFVGDLGPGPHTVRFTVPTGGQAINLDCFWIGSEPEDTGLLDSDGDGLSDRQERIQGTSIAAADSDGDGLSDREETQAGYTGTITDPLDPDCDNDNLNDWEESVAGTDPWNAASRFGFNVIAAATNHDPLLEWSAATGRLYHLYYCDGPLSNGMIYREIADPARIEVSAGIARYRDTNAAPLRAFRIGVRR